MLLKGLTILKNIERAFQTRHFFRTARGAVSFAAIVGGGFVAESAFAQEVCSPSGFDESRELCDVTTEGGASVSQAFGISGDGAMIVGLTGNYYDDEFRDFYSQNAATWSPSSGWNPLEQLPEATSSRAVGVNADGSIIVGTNSFETGTRAVRWINGEATDLGLLPEGISSEANAVSSDGSTIVGWGRIPDGNSTAWRAFRWTENGGMENLGTLGDSSIANAVNSDGTVIVGQTSGPEDIYWIYWQAFQWTEGQGMTFLENQVGSSTGRAYGVNDAGNIIVGTSSGAVRWVDGSVESLGSLSENSASDLAYAVNSEGNIIVGVSNTEDGRRAFRWIESETGDSEMQNLGVLTDQWESSARAVSDDGEIVVGNSGDRAFIWREIDNGGTMEDHANLLSSFPVLGNDSAVAQAEQQFALGQVMRQSSFAELGRSTISVNVDSQHTGRNPTTVGERTTSLASLSFGRGITDTLTLGGTISLSGTSLKNNAFDMDTGLGVAIWGQYSEGGAARTGLQLGGAIGYMRTEGEIARGRLLTDVVLATGQADVETRAIQATLGYGLQRNNWLVTPSFGIAHYDTKRSAYAETGAAFNAAYDEMSTSRTVATLGVSGEFEVSEQGSLSFGAGIDRELSSDNPRLSGTSDIPGLASFDIDSTFKPNRTRAFVSMGYTHDFENGSTVSSNLRVGEAVYGTTPSVGLGVSYSMQF